MAQFYKKSQCVLCSSLCSKIHGAPNAECPNGCAPIAGAPNAECSKILGAPMVVPQSTVLLRLCSNCSAPRSGFRWRNGQVIYSLDRSYLTKTALLLRFRRLCNSSWPNFPLTFKALDCKLHARSNVKERWYHFVTLVIKDQFKIIELIKENAKQKLICLSCALRLCVFNIRNICLVYLNVSFPHMPIKN